MPGPPQRIDDFAASFRADTSVIADARHRFGAWLQRVAPHGDTAEEMALVLSELVANAVSAAGGDRGRLVHVLACVDGHDVVLEVQNPVADWVDPQDRWDLSDPLRTGGRGLLIVDSLVDDLDVQHDLRAGTTTVRSRRSLDPPG